MVKMRWVVYDLQGILAYLFILVMPQLMHFFIYLSLLSSSLSLLTLLSFSLSLFLCHLFCVRYSLVSDARVFWENTTGAWYHDLHHLTTVVVLVLLPCYLDLATLSPVSLPSFYHDPGPATTPPKLLATPTFLILSSLQPCCPITTTTTTIPMPLTPPYACH